LIKAVKSSYVSELDTKSSGDIFFVPTGKDEPVRTKFGEGTEFTISIILA